MSQSYSSTSRKTQPEAQADMERVLQAVYVKYEVESGNAHPAAGIASNTTPKGKRAPRKCVPPAPAKSDSKLQDNSPTRKSARIPVASKRKVESESDSADANTLPPSKKAKVTPAKVQKHAGRFASVKSQLKRAKKIEKPASAKVDANEDGDAEKDSDTGAEQQDEEDGKSSKTKKQASKPFKGTTNAMGTSIEKPADAPNNEPWKCANRNCTSGQTWHNRDGPNSYGRKVISNFFGRNKKETNLIHPDVWHNYCRKDYQRGTYRVNIQSAQAKCEFYINNIQMQIERIKLWRPQATFTIQLSRGASKRIGDYYKELNKTNRDVVTAKQAVTKSAQVNAKGKEKPLSLEDAFPVEQLEHFDNNYTDSDKSFDDIEAILAWTKNLADKGEIESMPPMEFLINKQTDDEEVIDPADNYERWAALEDETDFISPNGSIAANAIPSIETAEHDGENTEEQANGQASAKNEEQENLYGLTDDETEDDELTDDEQPETPAPPPKKHQLNLTAEGMSTPLRSSTYGCIPDAALAAKRKRYQIDDGTEDAQSSPSKKQK